MPARLCAMNLLLHGIESPESDSPIYPESDSPIYVDDALRADPGQRFDMVLTNPPLGRSSSDSCEREDFWATTRNKQLNFVQHVVGRSSHRRSRYDIERGRLRLKLAYPTLLA